MSAPVAHACTRPVGSGESVAPCSDPDLERRALLTAIHLPSEVGASFDPNHFSATSHRTVARALLELRERGEAMDHNASFEVVAELRSKGHFERLPDDLREDLGNGEELGRVEMNVKTLRDVADMARRRRRYESHMQAAKALAEGDERHEHDLVDALSNEHREEKHQSEELTSLSSLLSPAIERAEQRRTGAEAPIPVPWPSYAENLGGGLWPGAHYVVSGTGVGKSQLTIQLAHSAARNGTPVAYVGLELEEMQIALRVVGEASGVRWSNLYRGACSEHDVAAARTASEQLQGLPFYCEFGDARGWPPSRLEGLCARIREKHPEGPFLVVLDYLQLVGDDASAYDRKPDTRERISNAALAVRDVARRHGAAVVVISSAARAHYGLLASDCKEAGLISRETYPKPERIIAQPSVLLGLGKESGETEYSADSVTTLIRWPTPLDTRETAIVCATPKVRSVGEHWCVLAFNGGRFREYAAHDIAELPAAPKQGKGGGGGKGARNEEELEERVLEAVRQAEEPLPSEYAIAKQTKGKNQKIYGAIKRLLDSGRLVETKSGITAVPGDEGGNR